MESVNIMAVRQVSTGSPTGSPEASRRQNQATVTDASGKVRPATAHHLHRRTSSSVSASAASSASHAQVSQTRRDTPSPTSPLDLGRLSVAEEAFLDNPVVSIGLSLIGGNTGLFNGTPEEVSTALIDVATKAHTDFAPGSQISRSQLLDTAFSIFTTFLSSNPSHSACKIADAIASILIPDSSPCLNIDASINFLEASPSNIGSFADALLPLIRQHGPNTSGMTRNKTANTVFKFISPSINSSAHLSPLGPDHKNAIAMAIAEKFVLNTLSLDRKGTAKEVENTDC